MITPLPRLWTVGSASPVETGLAVATGLVAATAVRNISGDLNAVFATLNKASPRASRTLGNDIHRHIDTTTFSIDVFVGFAAHWRHAITFGVQ